MNAKAFLQRYAREGSIYKVHTLSKLSLLGVLGLVFFLSDPRKILIFGLFILVLCFWSYSEFLRRPWRIAFILFVIVGSLLYDRGSGQALEKILFGGARLGMVMILGFLAEGALSDRELRALAGRRFAPVLIGALVGIQRNGEILQNISDAQQVRGIQPTWSMQKLYMFFLSKGSAWVTNMSRLNETVHNQFVLRGYSQFKSGLLLRKEFNLADFFAFALSGALLIIASISWK